MELKKFINMLFFFFFFTVAFVIYLELLQNCERQHLHGHLRKKKKKKTQRGTRRSGFPKVTEIQHLKLLCWSRENNICRLSAQPIIPPHTHACVSDKKKKKRGRKKKKKGLVTVQTFARGHAIWIQFDIRVNMCFYRGLSGQM